MQGSINSKAEILHIADKIEEYCDSGFRVDKNFTQSSISAGPLA